MWHRNAHPHAPLRLNTVIPLVRHSAEEGIQRENVRHIPPQCDRLGPSGVAAGGGTETPRGTSPRPATLSDSRGEFLCSDVLGRSGIYWRVFRRRRREDGPGGRRPWPAARCLLWWRARGPASDPEGAGEARGLSIVSRTFSRILSPP